MIRETVPARVHLAGNPSDGYGGAVLSTVFPRFSATVEVSPCDDLEVVGDERPRRVELGVSGDSALTGRGGDRLVAAALHCLARRLPGAVRPSGRFAWSTTIPRSVGLGGSSAIVLATLRAASAAWDVVGFDDPDDAAAMALRAETEVLGIAAGLADRTVQSRGGTVLTDCRVDPPSARGVEASGEIGLTVMWNLSAAAPSGDYHAELRARTAAGDPDIHRTMVELAALADTAASALGAGDVAALGAAMDASLEARRRMGAVPEAALDGVDELRDAGAAVNFAGSGGSLVVLGEAPTPGGWRAERILLGM